MKKSYWAAAVAIIALFGIAGCDDPVSATCLHTNDGVCDEGVSCPIGTDTADCAERPDRPYGPRIVPPSFGEATIGDIKLSAERPISPWIRLAEATGGAGPELKYSLKPVVPGTIFDEETRVLRGTPSPSAGGIHDMTYQAQDSAGQASVLTFRIIVVVNPPHLVGKVWQSNIPLGEGFFLLPLSSFVMTNADRTSGGEYFLIDFDTRYETSFVLLDGIPTKTVALYSKPYNQEIRWRVVYGLEFHSETSGLYRRTTSGDLPLEFQNGPLGFQHGDAQGAFTLHDASYCSGVGFVDGAVFSAYWEKSGDHNYNLMFRVEGIGRVRAVYRIWKDEVPTLGAVASSVTVGPGLHLARLVYHDVISKYKVAIVTTLANVDVEWGGYVGITQPIVDPVAGTQEWVDLACQQERGLLSVLKSVDPADIGAGKIHIESR